MLMKVLEILSCTWLLMAILSAAQSSTDSSSKPAVLDINGRPLQRDQTYLIKSDKNHFLAFHPDSSQSPCPLFISQEVGGGDPTVFEPLVKGDTVVREDSDFKIYYDIYTTCVQSTYWRPNGTEKHSKRFIELWVEERDGSPNAYFRIRKNKGAYNFWWCPLDVCPTCTPQCSAVGLFNANGAAFAALDGPGSLAVSFIKFDNKM